MSLGFPRAMRRSKYSNRPLRCRANHMHQSTLEARRCDELQLMETGGLIRDLEQQPRYRLDVNGIHICTIIPDFRYTDCESDAVVVEDSKGVATAEWKLKRKLLWALHGIEVIEVRRSGRQGWKRLALNGRDRSQEGDTES